MREQANLTKKLFMQAMWIQKGKELIEKNLLKKAVLCFSAANNIEYQNAKKQIFNSKIKGEFNASTKKCQG